MTPPSEAWATQTPTNQRTGTREGEIAVRYMHMHTQFGNGKPIKSIIRLTPQSRKRTTKHRGPHETDVGFNVSMGRTHIMCDGNDSSVVFGNYHQEKGMGLLTLGNYN